MNRHRTGPGIGVILGEYRIVGRTEKGFASARGDGTQQYQHHETVGIARKHGCNAEKQNAERNDEFAREAVAHPSSDRHHNRKGKIEYRGDEANGCIRQVQSIPYGG